MRPLLVALLLMPIGASDEFQVTPNVANTLNYLYENLNIEFAFCAYGKERNGLTIEQVILPTINQATGSYIWYDYKSCPKRNLLGMGHSHPGDSLCNLSRIDIYSFLHMEFKYGFLMCKGQELRVFIKSEVRAELIQRGLLAEALTPPWQ